MREKKDFRQKGHIQQNPMHINSGNHYGRESWRNGNRSRQGKADNDFIQQFGRLGIASTSTKMNLSSPLYD